MMNTSLPDNSETSVQDNSISDPTHELQEQELEASEPDEEHVQVTPILLMIGVAAVVLGIAAGLVMSFTATGHG